MVLLSLGKEFSSNWLFKCEKTNGFGEFDDGCANFGDEGFGEFDDGCANFGDEDLDGEMKDWNLEVYDN